MWILTYRYSNELLFFIQLSKLEIHECYHVVQYWIHNLRPCLVNFVAWPETKQQNIIALSNKPLAQLTSNAKPETVLSKEHTSIVRSISEIHAQLGNGLSLAKSLDI